MPPTVPWQEISLLITTLVFSLGVAYRLGRESMRIDKLEQWRVESLADQRVWREEMRTGLNAVFKQIRHTESLIRNTRHTGESRGGEDDS